MPHTRFGNDNQCHTLAQLGLRKVAHIANTQQGSAFVVSKIATEDSSLLVTGFLREASENPSLSSINELCFKYLLPERMIVKSADKRYYATHQKPFEDIVFEASIVQKITEKMNSPDEIVQYFGLFEDDNQYLLLIEEGGMGLFEFVKEAHRRIESGAIAIAEWQRIVCILFAGITKAVHWLHHTAHCCHLDISLENVVLAKDMYFDEKTNTYENIGVRLIDFGMSRTFAPNDPHYASTKYVGKTMYKAPQVFERIKYRANKADVWSLAMTLWMMTVGSPLYSEPTDNDVAFRLLHAGHLGRILQRWQRSHYVGRDQLHLLNKMLQVDESKRYSMADVVQHSWLTSCHKYSASKPSIGGSVTNIVHFHQLSASVIGDRQQS